MLALAQPAQSEVVVTKKTIPIVGQVDIDMNHDGVTDLTFDNSYSFGSALLFMSADGAVGTAYASALRRGANIGPSAHFNPFRANIERGFGIESGGSDRLVGNWGGNPKNRYLGVRFLINGQTHYGWVRLTVITEPGPSWSATITAYAYETEPNKAILAGTAEKAAAELQVPENTQAGPSLGMLAAGADGLPLWRREEGLNSN
jgi:hypothetical protein